MLYKIEIKDKPDIYDAVGEAVKKDILDLGITGVARVAFSQVYSLEGDLSADQVRRVCGMLLADPVAQDYRVLIPRDKAARGERASEAPASETLAREALASEARIAEVAYNPGVMDPAEESVSKGIRDLGIGGLRTVRTARRYYLQGALSDADFALVCEKLLYNKLIQHIVPPGAPEWPAEQASEEPFRLTTVKLLDVSDERLLELSRKGQLFLNLDEMRSIRDYFRGAGRNPTDCELETVAQTWSEHCYHKTFRGRIEYVERIRGKRDEVRRKKKIIDNLLKTTIMKATTELKKPWCVSVFKDNSGVIAFDDKHNICFKVETHNHPSALEPFGGANTGIGGCIRDPMGTGLGAKPVATTDVFCFAPPDHPFDALPPGTLHPKRVMKGVVAGVRDYGNKMGIPTVNGAVLFHRGFVGNPLVYCGTVGIMPKDKSFKRTYAGDIVVVAGGRTGRDGIHGATFSSGELTHESEKISSGAVQIGNPIQEKKLLDAILKCRDENLYTAITDCGAGGLSSAVGEMGAETGVRVDLEKAPLKYDGLSYMEIWISESQERMVLSVPPDKLSRLIEVFASENVEAAPIGEFTKTGRLELFYKGNRVCDLDMAFLHGGPPKIVKQAAFIQATYREPARSRVRDLTPALKDLLRHWDICSKEWVVRQYDHEVQGGSALKPLCGADNDGPSDASIVKPVLDSPKGIIISNGINFRYGFIDPYWMAAGCVDEALRQIIASGGSLKRAALLDNFCWGNPDKPDRLGGLVRCAFGCYAAAKGFGVPFISGKDSLYNEFTVPAGSGRGRSIAIPGTILISAMAVMEDTSRAVSMYAKAPGNLIYVVGLTRDELGGSHYYDLKRAIGNNVPKVNFKRALAAFNALSAASGRGLIRAMHDCSDGGLGVAAAELSFAGGLGMDMFLSSVPSEPKRLADDTLLFSESHSRFVVEVAKSDQKAFERLLKNARVAFGAAGCLNGSKVFRVFGRDGKVCVESDIETLREAWKGPLRW